MKPIDQKEIDNLSEIKDYNAEILEKEKKINAAIEQIVKEEE